MKFSTILRHLLAIMFAELIPYSIEDAKWWGFVLLFTLLLTINNVLISEKR